MNLAVNSNFPYMPGDKFSYIASQNRVLKKARVALFLFESN
jgi:hypothetical protein